MENHASAAASQYDVIIVGAGPAGLSAARTTARLGFKTLVLERLPEVGQTAHPCNAILAPMPGFLKGRRLLGDLFYPQLDLLIPLSLVVGYARFHRFISPGGYQVEAAMARGDSSPVAAIDRAGLLRLLAGQAEEAGAELRFGVEVTDLVRDRNSVLGVRISTGDIRAPIVLAAEGSSRRLSRIAGLYPTDGLPVRHALVITRELIAPQVRRHHLGQIMTFGRAYTSAAEGFGSVVMPLPGHASVSFTLLTERPDYLSVEPARCYLDEYIKEDPRVSGLLEHAQVVQESTYRVAIDKGPVRVARRGFLSLGDAATPAGHMGLLPAVYLGRQAALVAAEALDMGDLSARRLGMYGRYFHGSILETLQAESNLMLSLVRSSDADLDLLAQTLSRLPMAGPFITGWQGIPWEAAAWLAERYPAGTRQTDLLQAILDGERVERSHALFPAGVWTMPIGASQA